MLHLHHIFHATLYLMKATTPYLKAPCPCSSIILPTSCSKRMYAIGTSEELHCSLSVYLHKFLLL